MDFVYCLFQFHHNFQLFVLIVELRDVERLILIKPGVSFTQLLFPQLKLVITLEFVIEQSWSFSNDFRQFNFKLNSTSRYLFFFHQPSNTLI